MSTASVGSGSSCVATTTAAPAVGGADQPADDCGPGVGILSHGRLVEQDDARSVRQHRPRWRAAASPRPTDRNGCASRVPGQAESVEAGRRCRCGVPVDRAVSSTSSRTVCVRNMCSGFCGTHPTCDGEIARTHPGAVRRNASAVHPLQTTQGRRAPSTCPSLKARPAPKPGPGSNRPVKLTQRGGPMDAAECPGHQRDLDILGDQRQGARRPVSPAPR